MYLLIVFPGNEALGDRLAAHPGIELGKVHLHRFPDGEQLVRVEEEVTGRQVLILCTLHEPDKVILPLLFLAGLLKQKGAMQVLLIAPYLAYMRQDKAFHAGEAVTSDYFARLISQWFDVLITIDPHLHRHHYLSELYTIPAFSLHAEMVIAQYIHEHIHRPILIGPDAESEQWVSRIAQLAKCGFMILHKKRLGDEEVEIQLPASDLTRNFSPVIVDDIFSSGETLAVTIDLVLKEGWPPPYCIGVHGLFAGNAWEMLQKRGASQIITTNSVPHVTNGIDVSGLLLEKLAQLSEPL